MLLRPEVGTYKGERFALCSSTAAAGHAGGVGGEDGRDGALELIYSLKRSEWEPVRTKCNSSPSAR